MTAALIVLGVALIAAFFVLLFQRTQGRRRRPESHHYAARADEYEQQWNLESAPAAAPIVQDGWQWDPASQTWHPIGSTPEQWRAQQAAEADDGNPPPEPLLEIVEEWRPEPATEERPTLRPLPTPAPVAEPPSPKSTPAPVEYSLDESAPVPTGYTGPARQLHVPPPTVSLDAAVQQALGVSVRLGALGIDAPPLRQGRSDKVKVVISRAADAQARLVALMTDSQVPEVRTIETSAVMYVDLTGSSFQIRRLNPPDGEQLVSPTSTWEFDVVPVAAGRRTLTVSASMRIPVQDHGERTIAVPSLEEEFTVSVDRIYAGSAFARRNWQWVGTSAIALAALAAKVIWG